MNKTKTGILFFSILIFIFLITGCEQKDPVVPVGDETFNGILASDLTVSDINLHFEIPEKLSNNIKDLQFELNGVVFQLPADIDQFRDNDWNNDGIRLTKRPMAPLETTYFEPFQQNDDIIYLTLANPFDQNRILEKCPVTGVRMPSYETRLNTSLVFPGGITIGSTHDQVINTYGTPDKVIEVKNSQVLYYTIDEKLLGEAVIRIDSGTDLVCELEMIAFRTEGDENQRYANFTTMPSIINLEADESELAQIFETEPAQTSAVSE